MTQQRVLVALPTHQRPGPLVWSLSSVLRQTFADPTTARVVVINNDKARDDVEEAVQTARDENPSSPWSVEIVHRDPPMEPVLSWYGGIRDFASDGEVVFLHGDDDLLLRGAVDLRARLIRDADAEMLLTHSYSDLTFEDAEAKRGLSSSRSRWQAPDPRTRVKPLSVAETPAWGPAFIGNHTYRTTPRFWAAYEASLERMKKVPLRGIQQLAMLPFILPIDIAEHGSLACAEANTCVRGQSLQDLRRARFGHTTWQPGVLYAATLAVLEQNGWAGRDDLASWRKLLSDEVVRWLLPTLAFPQTREQMLKVLSLPAIRVRPKHAFELLRGVRMLASTAVSPRLKRNARPQGERFDRATLFAHLFETPGRG